MTYRRLPADLPDRLRKAGLKVVVIDGWRTRGRPSRSGEFKPVGSLNHHTGSRDEYGDAPNDLAYAKWMFITGRKDLPPPLCQLALSLEGVVYVGASGRANHAGTAKPSGSVAGGDGNALYVGTEWMLSGTQPIPKAMYDAGVRLNGVLMDVLGNSVETISCHYQTSTTGKWDIGDPNGVPFKGHKVLDVPKFRRHVKEWRASRNAPKTEAPITKPPATTASGHNKYPPAIIGGAVFHKAKKDSYASGCNFETIRVASASDADFEGIDLDLNVSMEKTAWGTHNTHPTRSDAWYDPAGKINDSHSIVKLPDSDINRLVVDYRGKQRPIRTAQELAKFCRDIKPRKLIPCFEAKHSAYFLKEEWWDEFRKSMPAGSTPIIMSLPVGKNNFGIRKLAAAHEVGLPTMLLWREDARPYMKGWENHVDLVKSRPGHKIYAVA